MYPYTDESHCTDSDKNNNSATTTAATMIKSHHKKNIKNLDQSFEEDSDKKSILLSLLCSLFICPIAFHFRNRTSDSFESDILAAILVITVSAIIVYIVNNILKQSRESMRKQFQQQEQINKSNKNTIFNVFNVSQDLKEKIKTNQPKIDSKYFNPRYIVHELMEMWGTTYTVITWSSFYIIGGTIGATERLAQKIKTKYNNRQREHQSYETFMNSSLSRNRSDSTSTNNTDSSRRQSKSSFRRMSSWTKKSFESTRNRLSRLISSGSEPLLRIGELGDSSVS